MIAYVRGRMSNPRLDIERAFCYTMVSGKTADRRSVIRQTAGGRDVPWLV